MLHDGIPKPQPVSGVVIQTRTSDYKGTVGN